MVLWEEEIRSDIYVEGYTGVTREGFTEDKPWKAVTCLWVEVKLNSTPGRES